jgi:hypothetical protein
LKKREQAQAAQMQERQGKLAELEPRLENQEQIESEIQRMNGF